jgi:hypothetical protein
MLCFIAEWANINASSLSFSNPTLDIKTSKTNANSRVDEEIFLLGNGVWFNL